MSEEVNFFGAVLEKKKSDIYTEQHKIWKDSELKGVKEYYMLFNGISQYLPYMGKAANLYMFYCINSKNKTGESWYAIETAANALKVSIRTINTWNDQLKELGLIFRKQGAGKSAHTFLLPTRDYVNNEYSTAYKSGKSSLNDIFDNVLNLYTDMGFDSCNIYHLFQWRKNKNSYDKPYNALIIALSRKCGKDTGIIRRVFIHIELPETDANFIEITDESKDLNDKNNYKQFKSPLTASTNSITRKAEKIIGLAVTSERNLMNYQNSTCPKLDIEFLTQLDSLSAKERENLPKTTLKEVKKNEQKK
mgnify:CR=1 FL=1